MLSLSKPSGKVAMPKSPLDLPGIFQQAIATFTRSGADGQESETGTIRVTGEIVTLRVNVTADTGSGSPTQSHYGDRFTGAAKLTILAVDNDIEQKTLPHYLFPGNHGTLVYLNKKREPETYLDENGNLQKQEITIRLDGGILRSSTHPIITPLIGQELPATLMEISYRNSFKIA